MPSMLVPRHLLGALALALAVTAQPALAAAPTVSDADYARAERMLGYLAQPLVDHQVSRVDWLDARHFAYTDHDASGDHLLRMDVASGKATPLLDQKALAKSLNALLATGDKPLDPARLSIRAITLAADGRYRFDVRGTTVLCDAKAHCAKAYAKDTLEPGTPSPDGRQEAFVRDWNLWLRDRASGQETQLTTDGSKDYGYATDNAGWSHSDKAIVAWSPDSKKIATFRQDQRKVGEMYLVKTKLGHPELEAWKYPLAGDKEVTMIERVVIDLPSRQLVRLQMAPDQRRSTLCDDMACAPDGVITDIKWAKDGKTFAFVSVSRDYKQAWFRIADTATGAVRTVFDEKVPSYYESGQVGANWDYLPESNEAIWFSERSNWGQLYLYDLASGQPKHAITRGDGNVTELLRVDATTRTAWFRGVGRTPGIDPYFQQLWKVSLDGGTPVLLSPEAADHAISLAPDGRHFVDAYSTATTPTVTVLRDAGDGRTTATIARTDIARLQQATGWVPPQPITVKARDGSTDLYGMLFKPSNFDAARKYPIVTYIYPGPQTGSVRGRSFLVDRSGNQALAELGFIVIAIDGMGTPWRSKAFHDTWYADMGDNTLPDQVAALKQLAARYPWIDAGRAGIWGHSGGGNASTTAMLRYPEVYKVAWSESGNHDNRLYEDAWGEKYQGLLTTDKDGKTSYDNQSNPALAARLQGRLMLVHGTMDDNVPPDHSLLMAQALMKAGKSFDMLMLPNARHGYGTEYTPYINRRRWDYFVEHLMGATHPQDYAMQPMPKP